MKAHSRVCARIDLDAMDHNLDVMRRKLKGDTPICAVIKANAYGHGAVPIAAHLEKREDIWGFACACAEEALQLRRAGIEKPLLLLGYAFPEDYRELVSEDIRACVFDYETAASLAACAAELGREAIVHIALDTGMSRIGFQAEAGAAAEVRRIAELPGLRIEGLFTHFARCDEPSLEPARRQYELYRSFEDMLEEEGVEIPIRHVCNSAGIMRFPDASRDMTRAGITLYGLTPSEEVAEEMRELRPVMSLVSHISHVKMLPPGRAVSYGGTFVTERDTLVATVPAGYADGYPRLLSGKGQVLIRGRRAPILGRVCMDQFMVDVTGIPEAARGDEVVLLGAQGDERISAEEIGRISGRFNYELVSCITQRVPREYYEQGRISCRRGLLDS